MVASSWLFLPTEQAITEMKSAYALQRKDKILIQGYSKSTAGLSIASEPVYVTAEDRIDDLGAKIRNALNGSIEGIRHPTQAEWKAIQAPMLEAAGVKSWSTLARNTKSVGRGTSMRERTIDCELTSSELGSALIKACRASI
jgi:hypothetical protein